MTELYLIIDLVGTFVIAISGALSTYKHKTDLFGIGILAFVTALGALRYSYDNLPVGWMLKHTIL